MEAKAAYILKNKRPSSTDAKAGPDSCEEYCGVQAPAGCWCDPQCVNFGDCCDDYEEFCVSSPPPPPTPGPTPSDLVVPGEFEESQAVLLRWSSNYSASFNSMYAELIDAIQQEVPVWIMGSSISDETDVINTLAVYGVTLTNYEFLEIPTNSIWTRDYGPWGFYYTDNDDIGIVDLHYYSSRPQDDQVPAYIAQYMGLDYYSSEIRHEGGNLMVDGFGHAYHSTSLFQNNSSINGWSEQTTRDTHEELFRTTNVTEATRLQCDGGTGHIDMYAKLIDEESMIVSEYPSSVTAVDRTIIEDNVDLFEAESSVFNTPLNIFRLPVPLEDNGGLNSTCNQFNNDARGYVNGLFVNKTLIVPIYSNDNSPSLNQEYDEAALDLIREALPGYNVVGVDARALTPLGGAIHCITMQIPASNPIRFKHPKIAGLQSARPNYHLMAEISNASGISEAKCLWKIKGSSMWNEISLVDSAGYFVGNIPNTNFTATDTIVYYLDATSNNGKNMTKPIVAPDGYYTFYFDEDFNPGEGCDVPSGLFTSDISNDGAQLNWMAVPDATSYTIVGGIVGQGSAQIEVPAPATSENVGGLLQPGQNYQWQVQANCADGSSPLSQPVFFTTNCGAPEGLSTNNVTSVSATANWNLVPGAFGYQLRGGPVGSGTTTFQTGPDENFLNTGQSLQPGTTYEWEVRAYCNSSLSQTSPWSETVTFTTAPAIMEQVEDIQASVIPNPNSGDFVLRIDHAGPNTEVRLFDLAGRVIHSEVTPGDFDTERDVFFSGIATGVYLVEVEDGVRRKVLKVFVR